MMGLRRATPGVLLLLTIAAGCRSSSERQATAAAEKASQLAISEKQQQLWQEAADKGAPGLERVPVVQAPVSQRDRSAQVPPSTPKPPQTITIPPRVLSEIRILVFPANPFEPYAGPAKVTALDQKGEWIQLELGGMRGTLTVVARAGGKPLPLMMDEMVSVVYEERQDPQIPNELIAIQTAGGAGIAHVIRSDTSPVATVVPLFSTNIKQPPVPGAALEFTAPGSLKPVSPGLGAPTLIGSDLAVLVLGNTRPPPKADVGPEDGAPFAINVLVWKVP
jgi:hypothetical protein